MYRCVFSGSLHASGIAWVALSLALAGCGKANKGPTFELTPVVGTVTLDGKPLADADVGFYLQGTSPQGNRILS